MSTDQTIVFPCAYPIKVIGEEDDAFVSNVCDIVAAHDPHFSSEKVVEKKSRAGRFCSLTIELQATGEAQILAIFNAVKQLPQVKLVL
jgi:putative lipoic acid-binding regulatory protein